ncbi:hypothetical protein BX616_005342 [Lobosporangium transversale]|uniref:Uncharacterized protein n=1 Tax=Lobosporangium transversale TaxID=64571 RepID=A0A1Y2GIR4_9FUNG|nr:hypothetical protein BCR41DRAFT_423321 [Lobosporangium transversale]KAF9915789.1 hypothetical protein BX616_005342 [Lobosporangium transversale]ORZ12135.1 hypothetical protein BCR41DRAFT_423321 [Lobosporangium transversale]|eukprot:XP_021880000.1 hypothetical protein BCR41DRAFT_423321 [Lobosporangium transversale]
MHTGTGAALFDMNSDTNQDQDQDQHQQHSHVSEKIHVSQEDGKIKGTIEETHSSSDAEDLARLEELIQMKTRIEAKLRAKQLQKAAKKSGKESAPVAMGTTSPGQLIAQAESNDSDICYDAPSTPTRPTLAEMLVCTTPGKNTSNGDTHSDEQATTEAVLTTPPKKNTTPLISPGFRSPSPPSPTRFFMSPSSPSSGRKRQHSPSPISRRLSSSMQGRHASPTPSTQRQRQYNANFSGTRVNTPSFHKISEMSSPRDGTSGTIENTFPDLPDNELDSTFLDALFDSDDDVQSFDTCGSIMPCSPSVTNSENLDGRCALSQVLGETGVSNNKLTEAVEAQKLKRETELTRKQFPKATFLTMAAASEPISAAEVTRLGHTSGFDPLTGLRIKDRETGCEDMARMTRGLKNVHIKDGERIREKSLKPYAAGLLSSSTSISIPGSAATDSDISGIANGQNGGSWVVGGVIGAKSKIRMTKKKMQYCHFQLCDLKSHMINVFMFRKVMDKHHGRLRIGDVVIIMDPKVLNQAERAGILGVEVEHPDCLLVVGTSADFGQCEAIKLDGKECGRVVDRRASRLCAHHIMMLTNKRRNQHGCLIAGTSSIYDLEKPLAQMPSPSVLRKVGESSFKSPSSARLRMMARDYKETTYIFDDGGIGTSSLLDSKASKKSLAQEDSILSSFLMSQNNPGGQYLRQAKASKDVAWAKDVTSPKTPPNNSELFPAEMVRRMGYNPVTGQFVPGSPKRNNDDLEARERSIRLLTERIKSPPSPMRPLSNLLPSERKRTIDVKGTTRPIALPRSSKAALAALDSKNNGGREIKGDVFFGTRQPVPAAPGSGAAKKWVDLDDGSDNEGERLLSLSEQRAKNMVEARNARNRAASASAEQSVIGGAGSRNPTQSNTVSQIARILPATSTEKGKQRRLTANDPILSTLASVATLKAPPRPGNCKDQRAISNADTQSLTLAASPFSSSSSSQLPDPNKKDHANKKQRFVDLSDSE